MPIEVVVVIGVVMALAFDVINGFHDAANSIATIVSTRVLSPRQAVLWAAFFNLVALLIFGEGVARTVSGIVKVDPSDGGFVFVILAGLIGAIIWNLLTWVWGLPSSSSHAILGGFGGAGVTYAGFGVLVKSKVYLTMAFIVVAPVLGFLLGYLIMLSVLWLSHRSRP